MPTMQRQRNSKGHFVKATRATTRSTAIATRGPRTAVRGRRKVIYRTRTVGSVSAAAPRRRRAVGGGGGPKLVHVALATLVLGYMTGPKGPKFVTEQVAKLPGVATFGGAAVVGGIALGVDKFVKPNKYLKALGYAGVVLAAAQVGAKGSDFKYVGELSSGDYTGDITGDDPDDVGDADNY